jgi:beta-N-acetylhexosaminidase
VILHCNGEMAEMAEIAGRTPLLDGAVARRAARAEAQRGSREPVDMREACARYSELTGETLHA